MAKKKIDTGSSEKNQAPAKKPAAATAAEKKPAASATSAAAKTSATAKPAAKAGGSKPASSPSAPAGAPAIDTSLAANAAAAIIANKASAAAGNKSQPQKKESSTFKQMKAGLNKPASGALGGAFGVGGPQQKKTKQNYGGGQQVGHNQTFGSDVNRAGVPRRTPG